MHSASTFLHAGAQESHIHDFQVLSQNITHITLSWEIVADYFHPSSNPAVNSFSLMYEYRSLFTSSLYIRFSETTHNGSTFTYTSPFEAFYINNYYSKYHSGEFVMWIQIGVYNYTDYSYSYTASESLYVKFGKCA